MPEGFPSYPKVHNLGHREIDALFDGPVIVQEKVDGSQINFRWDTDGLHVRSKGSWQYGGPDHRVEPDGLFKPAVDHLLDVGPTGEGLIFRGETLVKPKHNTLAYERIPAGFVVLFDVTTDGWHRGDDVAGWADAFAVEYVTERVISAIDLEELERQVEEAKPLLGGEHAEGLVFKTFERFSRDGKPLMGKLVRSEFKEKHKREWKGSSRKDVVQAVIDSLNTDARFEKAVQHLRDGGELLDAPQDIGRLMVEVKSDTVDEELDWIKDRLWEAFGAQIQRGIGRGLPEWYKRRLVERQFSGGETAA
jgi:hypothetical protein